MDLGHVARLSRIEHGDPPGKPRDTSRGRGDVRSVERWSVRGTRGVWRHRFDSGFSIRCGCERRRTTLWAESTLNAKHERRDKKTRISKSETNPNDQNPKFQTRSFRVEILNFGFECLFRTSSFGFRILLRPQG